MIKVSVLIPFISIPESAPMPLVVDYISDPIIIEYAWWAFHFAVIEWETFCYKYAVKLFY